MGANPGTYFAIICFILIYQRATVATLDNTNVG
jgi:hypothetical protein